MTYEFQEKMKLQFWWMGMEKKDIEQKEYGGLMKKDLVDAFF